MTEKDLARFEAVNYPRAGVNAELCTEIRRCWKRITDLLTANSREVERRRTAEKRVINLRLHVKHVLGCSGDPGDCEYCADAKKDAEHQS